MDSSEELARKYDGILVTDPLALAQANISRRFALKPIAKCLEDKIFGTSWMLGEEIG